MFNCDKARWHQYALATLLYEQLQSLMEEIIILSLYSPPPVLQDNLQQLIVMPLPNILCIAKDPISGNTQLTVTK